MTQSIESHVSATLLSETGIAQQDGWNTTNFTMENIILRLASLSHTVGGCGFLWNWGGGGKRTSRVVGNLEAQWENAARMNGHWLARAHRQQQDAGTFGGAECSAPPGICIGISILYLCISHVCGIVLATLACVFCGIIFVWFCRWVGR